jgi:hypothetical protein
MASNGNNLKKLSGYSTFIRLSLRNTHKSHAFLGLRNIIGQQAAS